MPPRTWPDGRVFALGLAGIALITLWRVALLPFDRADLFVDDAQYWFWSKELAWGYYSKPPLIAWIIRASTTIGGDAAFWIRLPLPLIHAGTAVLMALIGRRLFGPLIGGLAGLAFVSSPGAALGSLLLSTDTPMLLFFALAMLAQLHLGEERSAGWAVVLGAAIGLGLLAKYAMIYFPISAVIAAVAMPMARTGWRDAAIAAAVALALVAPNLAWNAAHQFATIHHTANNADWSESPFDLVGLRNFLTGQFAVAGPVLFAAYLAGLARIRRVAGIGYGAAMSLPVFAIVSVQALIADANANWAAAGHLGAMLVGIAVLAGWPWLLALSFAVNLAVTAAMPVAAVFADSWRIGPNLVLARYVGQSEVSRWAADQARDQGLDTLVSSNRAYLADFFYTLRNSDLAIYAEPTEGFPSDTYAQQQPLPAGSGEVLYFTHSERGPGCKDQSVIARPVARFTPTQGFSANRTILAFRVPRGCWFPANH